VRRPAIRVLCLRGALCLGGALWLTACVGLPPKAAPPQLIAAAPLSNSGATPTAWPRADWWQEFGDATLDQLVERALANSPDLATAQARLDTARAAVDATLAGFRPQLGAGADASRQRLSDNGLIPPTFLGFNWYNQFDLGLQASYSLGKAPRHRSATLARLDEQHAAAAERDAVALALAGDVVQTYYGWQSDQARLELAIQRVAAATEQESIATARVDAGIARDEESQLAELELLSARDNQREVEISSQLRLITLTALLGDAPADLPVITVQPWPDLQAGLPENAKLDLLARRPDIAAARWQVEAALQNRAGARSDFYPDVSFKALLGVTSRDLGVLLESGSAAHSIAAAVHLPLFDGGALRAAYARSNAELDAAVARYRASVIAAAREVNSQLAARATLEQEAALREQAVLAAETLHASATARATAGVSDQRPAIIAALQSLALRDAAAQTQLARLNAELELIRALGGGYRMESQS
jgi:outer membrane protein, multidrug efflux system